MPLLHQPGAGKSERQRHCSGELKLLCSFSALLQCRGAWQAVCRQPGH